MAKLKDGTRVYGNVTIDSAASVTTLNASTVNSSSFLMSNGVDLIALSQTGSSTANDAYAQANTARTQANNAYAEANLKLNLTGGTLTGSLNISGDLSVTNGNVYLSGNTTFINVSTYSVDDSLVYFAANNELSDTVDIGFIGAKNTSGSYTHTGLARHAADAIWYLFDNLADEGHLNNIVDVANTTYALLRANIDAQSLDAGKANITTANVTTVNAQNFLTTAGLDVTGQANTARDTANGAYAQANTARTTANDAYARANSDYQPAVTELAVTNNGATAYRFDQYGTVDDPAIYIRAGETIAFNLNNAGHPFAIRVSSGGANYDTGLTHVATDGTVSTGSNAQGKVSGKLYWKVPYELLGNTYVYQCTVHAGMVGNIIIEPPGTVVYAQANGAYAQANVAYGQANDAYSQANTARGQANTAYGQANAAYADANTRVLKAGDTMTGNLNVAATIISQNIVPNLNVTYSLGTPTLRFKDLYVGGSTIYIGDAVLSTAGDEMRANTFNAAVSMLVAGVNVLDTANGAYAQANGAYGQANGAYAQANGAYAQANSARDVANGAYSQANGAYGQANGAYGQANSAYGQANSAYTAANNAKVTVYANSGAANATTQTVNFVNTATILVSVANTAGNANITMSIIGTPYDQANTARDTANSAYGGANTANTNALNAYGQANTATTNAGNAYDQANNARGQANTAYGQANAAYGQANSAYTAANNAKVTVYANSGAANATTQTVNFVNTASILVAVANTSGNANITFDLIGTPYDQANTARNTANGAYSQANGAYAQANGAYGQANIAYGQANAAYGQANAAYTAANNAKVTVFANSGAANATTQTINFVNTSTVLVTVANTAGNANITFDLIGTPYNQANTARDVANGAYGQANGAYAQANGAYAQANLAANFVAVYANNTVVYANANVNFNNTATVNVSVTANTTNKAANVEFSANATAIGTAITLKAYKDFVEANTATNAANTCDLSISNYFRRTLTNNTVQFTFTNAPASGTGQSFSLLLIQDATGSRNPTWANTIYWAGGSAPPATTNANARDLWTFITYDGGTTYWGTLTIKDAR